MITVAFGAPGNGQWVRTRTKAGRASFLAEKQMERERAQAARQRERWFFHRAWSRLRRFVGLPEHDSPDDTDRLEVSPRGVAHFPGCPYHDSDDLAGWGEVTVDAHAAWTSIANGYPVATGLGALKARKRCSDCAAHGPWQIEGKNVRTGDTR